MRTFIPSISFISSPETEKERLLYASESVANGFYPNHNFLITPSVIRGYENWSVVIPEVIRNVDLKYWSDANRLGSFMPKKISKHMIAQIEKFDLEPVNQKVIENIKNNWSEVEPQFWNALKTFFSQEISWIKDIEVRITKIGSPSTHYLLNKTKNQHLIINLREDAAIDGIGNLIVLSLIYPLEKELGLTFSHRQTLRNFIMTRKEFKKIFPDFKPKIYDSPKIPIYLKRKSDEYIKYLGIPNIIDPLKIINQNLFIFGSKEANLINLLIKFKGELVTYDQIADCIWGEGKFKSYWAINKLVQRVNKKIKGLNIIFEIKGVRGVGYRV